METTILHAGCMGDVISSLPIARHLGGAHYRICQYSNPDWAERKGMRGVRYEAIRPLLARQPYVLSVEFEDNAPCTHELEHWRGHHRPNRTLTASQAEYLGIADPIDMSPWLEVPGRGMLEGMIAVARTVRYRNPAFPWRMLVALNWRRMVFLGSADEHADFAREFGYPVERFPTGDMLEAAQVVAGCSLLIANQTAVCWIGMGLGVPLIQETCPGIADSMVPRDNAQYCLDGMVREPDGLGLNILGKDTCQLLAG